MGFSGNQMSAEHELYREKHLIIGSLTLSNSFCAAIDKPAPQPVGLAAPFQQAMP